MITGVGFGKVILGSRCGSSLSLIETLMFMDKGPSEGGVASFMTVRDCPSYIRYLVYGDGRFLWK